MKKERLSVQQAVLRGQQLPFAYIARLSSVYVGANPAQLDMDELLEARLFAPDAEIRIFPEDGGFGAVVLQQEEGDVFMDKTSELRSKEFGKTLTIRQYVDYDSDGQAYICDMRLLNWEEDA